MDLSEDADIKLWELSLPIMLLYMLGLVFQARLVPLGISVHFRFNDLDVTLTL